MKLSILVPTLNNVDYLKLTMNAIREYTTVEYEILVYANQASEEMIDYLKNETFNYYKISDTNRKISYPCNHLAKRATGDVIIYIGDDLFVTPGWDTAIQAGLNFSIPYQYLTICMFEHNHTNICTNSPINFGTTVNTFQKEKFLTEWKMARRINQDIVSPLGPPIMTKLLWDEIGGFDEDLFPDYASDCDMIARIYQRASISGLQYEFRGLANCGAYHFQSIGMNKMENLPLHQMKGNAMFQWKWGITTTYLWDKIIGAGRVIDMEEK